VLESRIFPENLETWQFGDSTKGPRGRYRQRKKLSSNHTASHIWEEKLIKIKLSDVLTPLHSPHQFGFTSGRSTTDALLTYKPAVSDSPRKYVLTIFVDIRGAFDNVWWPGLFDTLRIKQLPHEILAIIKNYLTDRAVSFTQGNVTVTKNVT
jgi:hypothetical protein